MSTAHLRPIPTDPGELLRYRCIADVDPETPGDHLAFDVRLPLAVGALRRLPVRCVCGAKLVHWAAGYRVEMKAVTPTAGGGG